VSPPWRHLEVVEETGSTNSDLLARAGAGDDIAGAVLVAEHQTAGRGRDGRSWRTAPRTQIAMSVAVAGGDVPTERWGLLPLAAGVAVVDTVRASGVDHAGLKWPNDVLAGHGKLAGILAEVAPSKSVIVVGIGLNVFRSADGPVDPVAVSLTELVAGDPDRDQLVIRLLHELGVRINHWRDSRGTDAQLLSDYVARSATIGTQVRALLPGGGSIEGVARAVDDDGRLLIDANGGLTAVSAGDIVHLRPGRPR
jgi:BirA family biotin operon repressor/biotin-[acetyl-CoA-carboxylase] ligase